MDGYRDAQGKKDQLGFQAFFVPTFDAKSGTMLSQFPALVNPLLAVNAYHGDLGVDSGIPQSVYQLNTKHMKAFKDAKGQLLKKLLEPGDTMRLPNGAGSITFEKDIKEWAGFEIVQEPGGGWALGGAFAAIFGLAASLFIQRRRVWVRAVRGADGVTVVEMAGLGRSESARLPEELGDLAGLLYDRAPSAAVNDDAPGAAPDDGSSGDPDDTSTGVSAGTSSGASTDTSAHVSTDTSAGASAGASAKSPAVPAEGAEK
jgi:cytochrome c biogenesis protein